MVCNFLPSAYFLKFEIIPKLPEKILRRIIFDISGTDGRAAPEMTQLIRKCLCKIPIAHHVGEAGSETKGGTTDLDSVETLPKLLVPAWQGILPKLNWSPFSLGG